MSYKDENDVLFNSMMDTYFLQQFKESQYNRHLELIISPKCNLGCKYCYVNRYYPSVFKMNKNDEETVLNNLRQILDWYTKNKFICNLEIFSGEPFAQEIGFKALEVIYDHFKDKELKPSKILVPSNFTFLHSSALESRVTELIDKFALAGISLILSCSYDGALCQSDRPKKIDLDLPIEFLPQEEFEDKLFRFCKKNTFMFHPMLYYDTIDKWKDNFDWYQSRFKKYNFDYDSLYLLAVRNEGWTTQNCADLYNFIKYIIKDSWEHYHKDFDKYYYFLFNGPGRGFNILSSYLINNGHGATCTIQSDLSVKLLDLTIYPCHRHLYPNMKFGTFRDGKFVDCNPALAAAYWGHNKNESFQCIDCPININCGGQCLGACYETNLNSFNPINNVCKVHFYTLKGIIDGFKEIGIYDRLKAKLSKEITYGLDFVENRELIYE